jgi:riboflavin biosynthesis pyrimidine reductase
VNLTRLIPSTAAEFDLDSEGAAAELSELYRPPRKRWLRLNLVASINGNAAGPDGTSDGLTSRTDRRILGAIRRLSDVVLVGASSVRKEGYFLPKTAPLAIITGSGDLSGHQIPVDVAAGRVIVLCPPSAQDALESSLGDRAVTVITLPGPRISPAEAVTALHRLGHDSIVCEGGPSLAAQLIDADLVDELCLSTSPMLNGTDVPVLSGLARGKTLQLSQLLTDPASGLYARWTVRD